MSLRHRFADAIAFGCPSLAPGQIGAYAAFLYKDQIPGWRPAQFGLKALTCPLSFGSVSFDRCGCLFSAAGPKLSVCVRVQTRW